MGLTESGVCKEALNSGKNVEVTELVSFQFGGWVGVEACHRWGDIAERSRHQLNLRQQYGMEGQLGI